jgi:hypothetical protein
VANCYLLVVCESSALDQNNNTWSLFNILESIELLPNAPPPGSANLVLPLQLHAHWEFAPEEFGVQFEWRFVMAAEGQERRSKGFTLRTEKRFHRHRIQGIPILLEGDLHLFAEWRRDEGAWQRSAISWPLRVNRT